MNFKNTAIAEIQTIAAEFEGYSLGQIIYAVLTHAPEGVSVKEWLFNISDEDLYTLIEKVKLNERE